MDNNAPHVVTLTPIPISHLLPTGSIQKHVGQPLPESSQAALNASQEEGGSQK